MYSGVVFSWEPEGIFENPLWSSESLGIFPLKDALVPLDFHSILFAYQICPKGDSIPLRGSKARQSILYSHSWVSLSKSVFQVESPLWASSCALRESELWAQHPMMKTSFTAGLLGEEMEVEPVVSIRICPLGQASSEVNPDA